MLVKIHVILEFLITICSDKLATGFRNYYAMLSKGFEEFSGHVLVKFLEQMLCCVSSLGFLFLLPSIINVLLISFTSEVLLWHMIYMYIFTIQIGGNYTQLCYYVAYALCGVHC